jgi:hypothetical protein
MNSFKGGGGGRAGGRKGKPENYLRLPINYIYALPSDSDQALWPVLIQNLTSETSESIFGHFGRIPWMVDQPTARPLPTQESITQKKTCIQVSEI